MNSHVQPAPAPPTRPKNAYIVFVTERMPLRPAHVIPKEYFPILAAQWNVLPEEEKQKYHRIAAESKVEYDKLLDEYNRTYSKDQIKLYNDIKKASRRGANNSGDDKKGVRKQRNPEAETRPPNSYSLFLSDFSKLKKSGQILVSPPDPSYTGRHNHVKDASKAWKTLTEEEKGVYKIRAEVLKSERAKSKVSKNGIHAQADKAAAAATATAANNAANNANLAAVSAAAATAAAQRTSQTANMVSARSTGADLRAIAPHVASTNGHSAQNSAMDGVQVDREDEDQEEAEEEYEEAEEEEEEEGDEEEEEEE